MALRLAKLETAGLPVDATACPRAAFLAAATAEVLHPAYCVDGSYLREAAKVHLGSLDHPRMVDATDLHQASSP